MKTQEAIQKFGSKRKIAELLGISVQAVQAWPENVPPLREYQLNDIIENLARIKTAKHAASQRMK